MKLPDNLPADTAAVRKQLESALPDAQVMDFHEGNPALSHGLENATAILSLICLVAMVLGAIGVAMAMHAHLEQRMDMLAILKAVGAGSTDLLRIFLLQTLGLGLAGGLLGVAAGIAVMAALPVVFGNLLPVHATLEFPWRSVAAGLGTGLLTTLLFCLPPLLDVRGVRPVLVLRRLVEPGPEGFRGWLARWWARRLQLAISVVVVLALGGIAWALSDSAKVGAWFALLFTIALVVLLVLAAVAPAHAALSAQPGPSAVAFLPAPRAGQSLPSRQPVGCCLGGARYGRHADSHRLSDAAGAPARSSRHRFAQAAPISSWSMSLPTKWPV